MPVPRALGRPVEPAELHPADLREGPLGGSNWALGLGRGLAPGVWRVWSRATDGAGNVEGIGLSRVNTGQFRVAPGGDVMPGRATVALVVAALAIVAPPAGATTADGRAAERAASWLAANSQGAPAGQQADVIVALRAAGRSRASLRPAPRPARARGAPVRRTAGGAGKVVMAAVAAGGDPRRLAGVDYVRRITSRYASGRYGATAFDQALSMLAIARFGGPVPGGRDPGRRSPRAARAAGASTSRAPAATRWTPPPS